jgi:hypothetical protein
MVVDCKRGGQTMESREWERVYNVGGSGLQVGKISNYLLLISQPDNMLSLFQYVLSALFFVASAYGQNATSEQLLNQKRTLSLGIVRLASSRNMFASSH